MGWRIDPAALRPLPRRHLLRWFALAVVALFAFVAVQVVASIMAVGLGVAFFLGGLGVFALLGVFLVVIHVLPGHGERRDGALPPRT